MNKTQIERANLINGILSAGDLAYIPNGDQLNEENLELLKTKQLKEIIENVKYLVNNKIVKTYIKDNFGIVETVGAGIFKYKYEMQEEDKKDLQYYMDCIKESFKNRNEYCNEFVTV